MDSSGAVGPGARKLGCLECPAFYLLPGLGTVYCHWKADRTDFCLQPGQFLGFHSSPYHRQPATGLLRRVIYCLGYSQRGLCNVLVLRTRNFAAVFKGEAQV